LYDEVIRQRPDAPDARLWRGGIYREMGDTAKAALDYEVATALRPEDALPRIVLAQLKTDGGALEEAATLIEKAIALEPKNADAYEARAANSVAEGRAKASAGDSVAAEKAFGQAEAAARKALSLNPKLAWARLNLGGALMELYRLHPAPDSKLAAEATS